MLLVALPALAANFSLTPANVSVTQGQQFNAVITLNPGGAKSYTAKVELKYPSDLLEVKSFSFASNWLPLTQAGYDLTDNIAGTLVKTGGYPGGADSALTFGTVTFAAKKSGSGAITVGANSAIYNASSANIMSGASGQISVAIVSAPAAPSSTPKPPTITGFVTTPTPTPEVEEEETVIPQTGPNLFAQIGDLITLGTGRAWVAALVIFVILGLAYYLVNYFRRKRA